MTIATMTRNQHQTCIDECNRCAQMCQMSAGLMSMNGQFSKDHCNICAISCEKCAQECSMFKDDHCQRCAQECRTCADECRRMSTM